MFSLLIGRNMRPFSYNNGPYSIRSSNIGGSKLLTTVYIVKQRHKTSTSSYILTYFYTSINWFNDRSRLSESKLRVRTTVDQLIDRSIHELHFDVSSITVYSVTTHTHRLHFFSSPNEKPDAQV